MAICFASSADAQVYKCKGAGGETVYSQRPCGADAQQVKVQGTKAPTITQDERAARQQVSRSVESNTAEIQENICINNGEGDVYRASNARIAGYQGQIHDLNRRIALANNNLAGATYESGLRQQIASLQQSISAERVSADQMALAVRQQCAEARMKADKEIEQRYAPPASPVAG